MKPPRWACCRSLLAGVSITLGLAFAGLAQPAAAADAPILLLDQAEFILNDGAEPPADSAAWKPQALPDAWASSRDGASGYAWYRIRFDLPLPPQSMQAVYLPSLRTVGAVVLNGTQIGQYGTFGKENGDAVPQVFAFPAALLHAGTNTLHVRLWVNPGWRGGLSAVRLGDEFTVVRAMERDHFIRVTAPELLCMVFAGLAGAYMLLIWFQRRRDSMFGYFGLAALTMAAWTGGNGGYWPDIPFPYGYMASDLIGYAKAALIIMYALRFAQWRWPRAERALWLWVVIVWSVDALDLVVPGQPLLSAVTTRLWLTTHIAALALMLWILWRLPSVESAMLTLGHVFSVTMLIFELVRPQLEGPNLNVLHMIPLFLIMGWVLSRRFVRSLNEAEQLNADLERRIELKHAELERNYGQMQQMSRQAAVVEERQRIMSDMHDGIGGQLISTLSLVEYGEASSAQVATALRECIDDLRLVIDSFVPTDDDLLPLLGTLRYRLEGRLKRQGIELDWRVQDVPKLACLTPQNLLHILRILQEAFTNILKHANASRISVATSVEGGGVSICVTDNGRGFSEPNRNGGHGLTNMLDRARRVGAQLTILPSAHGTTLSLLLPI